MVTKFAGVQKCLTHWMKTKKKKKKGKYDPWWFTFNISQYIILIFYENDTNKVKDSYHDDCLEKKHICLLNWDMAVSCSRNMNFVKCRVSETSAENIFNVDIFCAFFAHFCIGAFFCWSGWVDKTHPLYSYFSCSDPPLHSNIFSWPSP